MFVILRHVWEPLFFFCMWKTMNWSLILSKIMISTLGTEPRTSSALEFINVHECSTKPSRSYQRTGSLIHMLKKLARVSQSGRMFQERICMIQSESLRVISMTFLLVISVLCKTALSWELRTRSHNKNLLDILFTSPHYFCRKWIGTTNENSNFDLRA